MDQKITIWITWLSGGGVTPDKSDNYEQYTVGKICRIKQKTKASKKRKRLLGVRRQLVNNVDTGINLWTVNNESKNNNLNNMIKWWWCYPW